MPFDGQDPELANGDSPEALAKEAASDISGGPSLLQLALVVVLVCALAVGSVALLGQLDPTGPWRLMPLFALIVAIESVLTRRWLEWPSRRRQHRAYTLAELVFLLTLAPLFLWLASGEVPLPSSLVELLENPFAVFTLPLILYMLLAVLVWERAHGWAELFIHLSITPHEVKYHTSTPTQRWEDRSIVLPVKHRSALLTSFVHGWIVGGVFMIVMSALVSFDLSSVPAAFTGDQGLRTVTRLGLQQELLLALLAYFLGGLWLISQGRILVLKGRWLADRSRRDPDVLAKWRSWALFFIMALSLLALLLPIGTTYPLFQVARAVAQVLSTIVGAIFAFFLLVAFFILSLFPNSEAAEQPPMSLSELFGQNQAPAEPATVAPSLFAGSVFWLALIALTIVATLYFMRERGPDISLAQLQELWHRFRQWLIDLGHGAAARATLLGGPIRLRFRRPSLGDSGAAPFGFMRVGALPPKEQVRFLYLSLVRYAGKQGLPRSPVNTPIEFAQKLRASWPEAGDDLEHLTEAFIAARYSAVEIDDSRLRSAKEAWLRIRRRHSRQSRQGDTGATG